MNLHHECQTSEAASLPAEQKLRPSSPPSLRLVVPPAADRLVRFAAARGAAPGGYLPGTALLAPGARVGILCDTLHGDRELGLDYLAGLRAAAQLIRELGFEPVIDHKHAAVAPHFERWAGSVAERVEHLERLVEDYRVDALFPLFGKGGSHEVVDAVAASGFRPRRPLVLIGGFSHHTDWALFAQGARGQGFFSHVISATQCAYSQELPRANVDNLRSVLTAAARVEYGNLRLLNGRPLPELSGPLIGGNMGVIMANRDKPWMPNLRGRIVVCEDYDRHAHDFHRTFTAFARQLEHAGAAALLVCALLPIKRASHGQLDAEARRREQSKDRAEIANLVGEVASRVALPVFQQAELCGHGAMNYPLGMGGQARIVASEAGSYTLRNDLEVRS